MPSENRLPIPSEATNAGATQRAHERDPERPEERRPRPVAGPAAVAVPVVVVAAVRNGREADARDRGVGARERERVDPERDRDRARERAVTVIDERREQAERARAERDGAVRRGEHEAVGERERVVVAVGNEVGDRGVARREEHEPRGLEHERPEVDPPQRVHEREQGHHADAGGVHGEHRAPPVEPPHEPRSERAGHRGGREAEHEHRAHRGRRAAHVEREGHQRHRAHPVAEARDGLAEEQVAEVGGFEQPRERRTRGLDARVAGTLVVARRRRGHLLVRTKKCHPSHTQPTRTNARTARCCIAARSNATPSGKRPRVTTVAITSARPAAPRTHHPVSVATRPIARLPTGFTKRPPIRARARARTPPSAAGGASGRSRAAS